LQDVSPFYFAMPYYVYILKSLRDNSYYVGSTQDLNSRFGRHNQGQSKYTRNKRPWELEYSEEFQDKGAALRRENFIKRQESRGFIESLVRTSR
jgi:putative endonuclease